MKKIIWYLVICFCVSYGVFCMSGAIDFSLNHYEGNVENLSAAFIVLSFVKWLLLIFGFYFLLVLGGLTLGYLKGKSLQVKLNWKMDIVEKIAAVLFGVAGIFYVIYLVFDMLPHRNLNGVLGLGLFFIANCMSFILLENVYKAFLCDRKSLKT